MKVLLTGGLGYIGSHTILSLSQRMDVSIIIIIDNLSNSSIKIFENLKKVCSIPLKLYCSDLSKENLNILFSENKIDVVVHFAGLKSVEDSILLPLKYYLNNFCSTLNLLSVMEEFNVNNLIFSSSATVYGNENPPHSENTQTGRGILNPYGRSKYFIEEMLKDYSVSNPSFNITILRYFNPIGATIFNKEGISFGEIPSEKATNLVPVLLRRNDKNLPFYIFGNDYESRDGTAIRDFIHVRDLANAHSLSINNLKGLKIFNLGTGNGISVKEILDTFFKVNKETIKNIEIKERRNGDIPISISDPSLAMKELNWKCEETLCSAMRECYLHYLNQK